MVSRFGWLEMIGFLVWLVLGWFPGLGWPEMVGFRYLGDFQVWLVSAIWLFPIWLVSSLGWRFFLFLFFLFLVFNLFSSLDFGDIGDFGDGIW